MIEINSTKQPMNQWKQAIVSGNRFFNDGDLANAIRCYETAAQNAERLIYQWDDADEAVWSLIASYHNLADAYQKQLRDVPAKDPVERAHQALCEALQNYDGNAHWIAAILRGIACTYARLLVATNNTPSTTRDTPHLKPRVH